MTRFDGRIAVSEEPKESHEALEIAAGRRWTAPFVYVASVAAIVWTLAGLILGLVALAVWLLA
jgi:hypothetical protein